MTTSRNEGWREPNDIRDIDFGDGDDDGGALVPARPKPLPGAPYRSLELMVPCGR